MTRVPLNCPVCKGVRCAAYDVAANEAFRSRWGGDPHAPFVRCDACGHNAATHSYARWKTPADLPRPAGMSADEFGWRAALYFAWRTLPASEFVGVNLRVFADWLGENGRPEEAAARADWTPYGTGGDPKRADPKGWWQWAVTIAPGWTGVRTWRVEPTNDGDQVRLEKAIDFAKSKTVPSTHNAGWFLCWPPGVVRFTAPLYHDHTRYRATVSCTNSRLSSRSYERLFPHGYATLFHPPGSLDAPRQAGPTLFDEVAA